MRLLAWDTSSKIGAIAALEWDEKSRGGWDSVRLVSEWTLNLDTSQHSERLMWGLNQVLESARWKLEDIDQFAVGVGPGSFTGLRIGVTTARTLAHSMKKPLIALSSLAALARPAAQWLRLQSKRTILIATTDASKGELFALWGAAKSIVDCVVVAEGDMPGLWKRGVEEAALAPAELIKGVKRKLAENNTPSGWAVVGEGRFRYPDVWKSLPRVKRIDIPSIFSDHIQGRYLGQLAWEAIQAGLRQQALHVHPRYLRASDAEMKLKAGLLPAGPTRGE